MNRKEKEKNKWEKIRRTDSETKVLLEAVKQETMEDGNVMKSKVLEEIWAGGRRKRGTYGPLGTKLFKDEGERGKKRENKERGDKGR